MKRRRFIQTGLALGLGSRVIAALRREGLDEAVEVLSRATREGQVASAVLHVIQRESSFTRAFGKARSEGDVSFGIDLEADQRDGVDDVV